MPGLVATKLRTVLAKTALVGAAVVGLFLVAELAARALVPQPLPMLGRYGLTGVLWTPGYKSERLSLDTPPERFTFEVDPLGFRGKSLTTAVKAPDTYRIFCLAGATTEQVLDTLLHRVLKLSPDLVVVLEGHNELCLALDSSWDPLNLGPAEPPPRFKDWLIGASRLFAVLDDWQVRHHAPDKHGWYQKRALERRSKTAVSPVPFDTLRGLPAFTTALHRVALVCADAGVPCVLLTQPSLYKDVMTPAEDAALITGSGDLLKLDVPTLKRALDAYNDAVRRVAAADGARLGDLARAIPSDLDHFFDDVHFTARGNAAVAEAVEKVILADGALPKGAARPAR